MSKIQFDQKQLIEAATSAMHGAYAPYSNFHVGAALLTVDDEIISGCNIENASYGLSNCAERTALFKAVSQGKMKFKAIAIIGATDHPIAPCGACRQVIREFCDMDMPILLVNTKGDITVTDIETLLPNSFGPEDLR